MPLLHPALRSFGIAIAASFLLNVASFDISTCVVRSHASLPTSRSTVLTPGASQPGALSMRVRLPLAGSAHSPLSSGWFHSPGAIALSVPAFFFIP